MTFAERIRELREAAGLTLASLADAAGLGLPTVKDYEGGRRSPTLESAQKLAKALGVTCQAFDGCEFGNAGRAGRGTKAPSSPATPPAPAKGAKGPAAGRKRPRGTGGAGKG